MSIVRKVASTTILCMAGGFSYLVASMAMDRSPPVVYESATALTPEVPVGGILEVQYTVIRSRVCPVSSKRFVRDASGSVHAIPAWTVPSQLLAGRETFTRQIIVPQTVVPGPAVYGVSLDYACNVFHRLGFPIHVDSPPVNFQIVPGALPLLPYPDENSKCCSPE